MTQVDKELTTETYAPMIRAVLAEFTGQFKRLSGWQKYIVLRNEAINYAYNKLYCLYPGPKVDLGMVVEVYDKDAAYVTN